ncbi:hypothetical protein PC116_g24798 [Phytophthora cactorum]|nr:hypothetical protein PC119_g23528 [Phytophthora cactorum]KAG4226803.1 hypothetical protein PC116_g24798 [Phytophthora cactorum]
MNFLGWWNRPLPSEVPTGLEVLPGADYDVPLSDDDLPSTSYV